MIHALEYFDDFLNNPASLSNRQFNEKLSEWIDFVKANPDEYELFGKGWAEERTRIEADVNRRHKIRDEFEEIDFLIENMRDCDDAEIIKVQRRFLTFMKNYRLEYSYSDEMIASVEAVSNKFIKSVEEERIANTNLQIANAKVESSTNKLADTIFEASDRLGKPVIIPSYKTLKRGQDN